jgi:hypothetical protein
MAFISAPECCFQFPGILGTEVIDARDGSWRRSFTAWLHLAAEPSHVGVGVDGPACILHHPMAHSCQTRGHGLSSRRCLVLLQQWAVTPF